MDTSTFDLYRVLQSGPYDEAGLSQVKRLLGGQRRLARGKSDWKTLDELIQMLQEWAVAAGGGWLGASALAEAAEIAELDLRNAARAEQLRSQAIVTGRAASGLPAAPPVTSEGAIDANAELLHELKTLPPGALTQAFLTDAATEFEEEVRRSSSIPARPRTLPGAGPNELRAGSEPPEAERRQSKSGSAAARISEVPADRGRTASHGSVAAEAASGSQAPAARRRTTTVSGAVAAVGEPLAEAAAEGREVMRGAVAAVGEPMARAAGARRRVTTISGSVVAATDSMSEAVEERRSETAISRSALADAASPTEAAAVRARAADVAPRSTAPRAAADRTQEVHTIDVELSPLASVPPRIASERTQEVHTVDLELSSLSSIPPRAAADRTQEVHTIDVELSTQSSVPPLPAAEPAAAAEDELAAQIAAAEEVLDSDTSPERVRELAELYAKRDGAGDREQAAVLYTTLGEVLGNPGGIAMLERALSLVPEHAEAKALLTRYTVRQRMPITSPKITVLGMQPRAAAIPQPPPAAARAVPPLAAAALGQSSAAMSAAPSLPPLSAAGASQRAPALQAQRASVAPAARASLRHSAPANDVLPLHGVPQVVTNPPAMPQISSLSPVVRSDASQLQMQSTAGSWKRLAVPSGLALSVAAAFGLYFASHARNSHELPSDFAPSAKAVLTTNASAPQTAAANQPLAAAPEVKPDLAAQAKPADGQPLAAAAEVKPAQLAEAKPPAAAEPSAADTGAQPQSETPAPLAPPGPSHLPALTFEAAKLTGGKLSEAQLSEALDKAEPKFLACYAQASESKPRLKGRVIYSFTVRTNGKVTNIKRAGGTLRDESLLQCSVKVLENMRFPKPRKQSAQVKLPIQYKRT